MERLSRGELLLEIARRDELIAQLQEELRMARLAAAEDREGATSRRSELLWAQSPLEEQGEFTHARKIAVSAESGLHSNGQQQGARWGQGLAHKKDKRTAETIRTAILSNEFLRQLEQDEINQMIERMQPVQLDQGTQIVRQGELSSELFVLEEGRVQVTKDRRFVRVMEGPCVFGELAILYHCERTATVDALTPCRLWALHRTAFHTLMVQNAATRQEQNLGQLKRCRQLGELLDEGQLVVLAGQVREEFWQFRTEVERTQIRGRIYVITKGRITVRRRSSNDCAPELSVLTVGDAIGVEQLRQQRHSTGGTQFPRSQSPSALSSCSASSDCHYFVDSVEGCSLLAMLVEQVAAKLPSALCHPHSPSLEHHQGEHLQSSSSAALLVDATQKADERRGRFADGSQGTSTDNESVDAAAHAVDEAELELDEVELADLKTVATLGVGGFGRVNLVRHFNSDRVYALKVLNKKHIKEMNQIEHVLNERNILLDCRSDFIVKLYKTFRDSERLYMLMEYCPGGEVWTMLRNWGRFDEVTARFYCAAALEAFEYLHRRLVIYRDLKPENMLLDINGVPKLVDFGFAKRLPSEGARAWTFCGTAEYVAPEVILNKGQDCAVDLWSLGIFLYELLSGSPPFASTDPMHTYNSILRGVQVLAWPRYMSESSRSLICKFCRRDPTQRLGYGGRIEDARQDIWFKGFDFVAFRNHTMRPPIRPKIRSLIDTQNFDRYPSTDNFACGSEDSGWDEEF